MILINDSTDNERSGELQVLTENNKPLHSCYVKVYSKNQEGQVLFYKDGYTDLLGRFDYLSLSSSSLLRSATKLSILIASQSHGSKVMKVVPPKT